VVKFNTGAGEVTVDLREALGITDNQVPVATLLNGLSQQINAQLPGLDVDLLYVLQDDDPDGVDDRFNEALRRFEPHPPHHSQDHF
jgi:hypothetical protein